MYDFDLFVIGAGSGGVRAARVASELGARVAVAEERYLGGTCVNVGCIPKKLYTYAAHYRHDFEDSAAYGWSGSNPRFDWTVLRDNKKREITRLNGVYGKILNNAGVTLFDARATLRDAHTIMVDGEAYTSRYILLANGGWPFVPEFPGQELAVTSNEVFDLEEFPRRMLVVGGGYIAVEFAGIFSGLGADTTLSYRRELPLRGFDGDLRRFFLEQTGHYTNLLLGTNVTEIVKTGGGLEVNFKEREPLEVDCVLYATGRRPNTSALGLENTAVETDAAGAVVVDDAFRTSESSIYAVGDVIDRVALTPVALAEGTLVARRLFGDDDGAMDYEHVPTAVFSQPNIATVGLTEEKAREQYRDVAIFKTDFRHLKHTLTGRELRTFMKVIVNRPDDRVLGMHMVGDEAGEIIQGFAAAMNAGITKEALDRTIGIHPTAAEEFVTLRHEANS